MTPDSGNAQVVGMCKRRPQFDPEDYAQEWTELSLWGVRSDQIIDRSRPSEWWFKNKLTFLVSVSVCASCGEMFNPQQSGMLTRCSMNCGSNRKVPAA